MKMLENSKILWKKILWKIIFLFVFGLRIISQNFKKIEKIYKCWELGIFLWKSLKTEKFTSFENLEYFCKKKFFENEKKLQVLRTWNYFIKFLKKRKKITSVENLELFL